MNRPLPQPPRQPTRPRAWRGLVGALALGLLLASCADAPRASTDAADAADAADVADATDATDATRDATRDATASPDSGLPPGFDPTASWLQDGAVDATALTHWLRARQHRVWTSSPAVTPSPQGGSRVFVNEALAASLAQDARVHPIGAIAVRELYEDDLITPRALNLLIKLEADDGDGAGWLWYELTDLEPGGAPSVFERAAPRCLACHAAATDAIQSPWPLP